MFITPWYLVLAKRKDESSNYCICWQSQQIGPDIKRLLFIKPLMLYGEG